MLAKDRDAFFSFVQEHDSVLVTLISSDSADIQPVSDLAIGDREMLCLGNRRFLPRLEREWIPSSKQGPYYRINVLNTPVLEFTSSFQATWEGKPALGQGRLFGNFEPYLGKPAEFEKWYESLVRWIRKNFRKNPTSTGGYVGPAALEFYSKGGYLLPNFIPPKTKEWLKEIRKQHARWK